MLHAAPVEQPMPFLLASRTRRTRPRSSRFALTGVNSRVVVIGAPERRLTLPTSAAQYTRSSAVDQYAGRGRRRIGDVAPGATVQFVRTSH